MHAGKLRPTGGSHPGQTTLGNLPGCRQATRLLGLAVTDERTVRAAEALDKSLSHRGEGDRAWGRRLVCRYEAGEQRELHSAPLDAS